MSYKISEFAKRLGVSVDTLRRWDRTGKLVPNRTLGNQRMYTEIDFQKALRLTIEEKPKRAVIYCRVSSPSQKDDLQSQIQAMEYKAQQVLYVDRFEPTTKPCCKCGKMHDMPLSKRRMVCECGNDIDRDLNAAINILRLAKPKVKPVKKLKTSAKQESNSKHSIA